MKLRIPSQIVRVTVQLDESGEALDFRFIPRLAGLLQFSEPFFDALMFLDLLVDVQ